MRSARTRSRHSARPHEFVAANWSATMTRTRSGRRRSVAIPRELAGSDRSRLDRHRSVTTLDEPPGCMVTPSRQSPASIVRFWWLTTRSWASCAELVDQAEEAVQVDVVERGLDLVHHVERRRAAAEHGEQERQRGEAALAARQQRQLLHVLAAVGLASTSMPVFSRSSGSVSTSLPAAAGEQRGEQRGEVRRSRRRTRPRRRSGSRGRPALMTRMQVAAGGAHVLELLFQEAVTLLQLVELLERQRVDRAHAGAARARARARGPPRVTPSGSGGSRRPRRPRARCRARGAAPRRRPRGACAPRPRRSRPGAALAQLVELPSRRSPRRRRSSSRRWADAARTSSLWRRRCSGSSVVPDLDHLPMAVDQRGEPLDRAEDALDQRDAAAPASAGPTASASRRRSVSSRRRSRNCCSLVQAGVAHLEVSAASGQRGGLGRRAGSGLAGGAWRPRPRPLRRPRAPAAPRFELGDRGRARGRVRCVGVGDGRARCCRSRRALAALGLHAGQRLGAGRDGDRASCASSSTGDVGVACWRGRSQLGRGHGRAASRRCELGAGDPGAVAAASSSADAGGTRRRPAPTRHPVGPKRSPSAVTTTASGWASATSTAVVQPPSTHTAPAEQGVEQLAGTPVATAAHVRTDRAAGATGGAGTSPAGPSAQREHAPCTVVGCSARSALGEPVVGVGDDDGRQRLAERPPRPPASQPASISTRSSSVPSTPSTPARRSAPARARARVERQAAARRPGPRHVRRCRSAAALLAASAASRRRLGRDAGAASAASSSATRAALGRPRACSHSDRAALDLGVEPAAPLGRARLGASAAADAARSSACVEPRARSGSSPRTSAAALAARRRRDRRPSAPSSASAPLGGRAASSSAAQRARPPAPSRAERRPRTSQLGAQRCARRPRGWRPRRRPSADRGRARAHRRRSTSTRGQAAGPLAELLDPDQLVAQVDAAARAELGPRPPGRRCRAGPARPAARARPACSAALLARQRGRAGGAAPAISPPGEEDPQRRQLGDQLAVAAGGLGLALERAQLAAHLAQEVLDAQQAGLGGVEAALGLLLALAVLEDAGGFLDDRRGGPRAGRSAPRRSGPG